jgi:hypothetical protein
MAKFLFTYRVPRDYKPEPETGKAWMDWFEDMDPRLIDRGHGGFDAKALGNIGTDTRASGYSVVAAESLEAALAMAQDCPAIGFGGGVEVGEIPEFPPGVPPSRS